MPPDEIVVIFVCAASAAALGLVIAALIAYRLGR
jgi:hypothetical protein